MRRLPESTPKRVALLAGLVAVFAYANALGNGFAYDDQHIVVDDEAMGDLPGLVDRLGRPYWPEDEQAELGLWRPLTTAVLSVERAAFGLEPVGFHALNVLLHGVATAIVVLLATHFVGLVGAAVAGLLFALHPVHVEAVANVVGLAELLPAVLYLAACLLFLRWTEGREGGRLRFRHVGVLSLLYAAAFLGKESAITLPAALVVLDLVRRPVRLLRAGAYLRARSGLLASMGGTAILLLLIRLAVLGSVANPNPPLGAHLLTEIPRIWTLGVVWFEYARLLVFPWALSVDYSPDVIPVLTVWTPRGVAGVVSALGVLVVSWVSWRLAGASVRSLEAGSAGAAHGEPPHDEAAAFGNRGAGDPRIAPAHALPTDDRVPTGRLPGFAVVWFLVTLSPVSNVLFLSGVLLAERTLYLPSVGFVVLAGGLADVGFRRVRLPTLVAVTSFCVLYAARTWTRTPTWASTESVFATLIEDRPEAGRAQWILGDILRSRGRSVEANRAYRRAVGLLDSTYRLLMELGWDAVERDEVRLGEFLLLRAWQDRPDQASAPRRLAVLYSRQGRHEEVVDFARHTVALAPADVASWHLLASSSASLGRWREALAARERVLALGEDHWQQWLSLARLHLTMGNVEEAERAFGEALERAESEVERAFIDASFLPYVVPGGP